MSDTKSLTARLSVGDQELELPVILGSEGEIAIDIRRLRAETGAITYDPGLGNTGSCLSRITFLNGEEGILRYCGYPIEELAKNSSFLEVAWLLINQELPTREQLSIFESEITTHSMIHENMRGFFSALPRRGHPMAICAAAAGALSTFYQDVKYDDPADRRWAAAVRLLAKMPTIAAYSYKHSMGQPFVYPRNDLPYTANMLHMGEDPGEVPHAPPPQEAKKSAQDPGEAPVKLETIPDLHRPASDAGDMLDLDVELEDPMASNVGDDTCELEPIEDYDFEQEEREVAAQKSARSWRAGKGGPSGSTALSQPEESCEDVEEEDEHRDAMDPLLPGPFAKLADDPPRLKKALALMVKNGLMERQEARSIYAKARASK
ncbi:MAG: citrate/2-methylcitrate synthase, partial [Planctomycetota bacterium]